MGKLQIRRGAQVPAQLAAGEPFFDGTDLHIGKLAGTGGNQKIGGYTHPATHSLSIITETEGLKVMTAAERTKLAAIPENRTYSPSVKFDNSVNVMKAVGNKIIIGGNITGGLGVIEDYDVTRTIFNVSGAINDLIVNGYNEYYSFVAVGDFQGFLCLYDSYSQRLSYPIATIDNSVYAVALIGNEIFVAGSFTGYFKRIKPSLDDFDDNYVPSLPENTINVNVFGAQGAKIILVVQTTVNTNTTQFLIRLNSDGTGDSSFTPPAIDGTIVALQVESTQKIIICGQFPGGIMRLNSDGTVDSSFTSPLASGADVRNVNQIGDKYLIGGLQLDIEANNLLRLNADGSVDSSFTPLLISGYANPVTIINDYIAVFDISSNTVNYYNQDGSIAQMQQSAFDELSKKIQMLDKITIQ